MVMVVMVVMATRTMARAAVQAEAGKAAAPVQVLHVSGRPWLEQHALQFCAHL